MFRSALAAALFALLLGCDTTVSKQNPGPVVPDIEGASASVGEGAQPSGSPMTETAPAESTPAESPAEKGVIGKTTNKVVDANKALQDPEIVLAEGSTADGIDPFSQAGSVYFSAMARVSTLGMQQAVNMKKAVEGRWPTYDEYMQIMKENNVEFVKLRSYEMYGYDDKTGKILVLMDKRLHREHLKRAGIEPPSE